MKRTVLLGWLLVGMVVFAGGVTGTETATPVNRTTTGTTVPEPADTTLPETTAKTTNATARQQPETTEQSGRNASNVTVPINSTTLSGPNCSVSVATHGNVTIPIAKSGNETIETANVSAAWLVYTNRVDSVRERVGERLPEWVSNTSAIRSTSIGRSNNTTVQGESVGKVVVGVAPEQVNEIREDIPQQINCVEIAVRPMGRIVASGGVSASSNESTLISTNITTMENVTVMTAATTDSTSLTETGSTTSDSTTTSSTGPGFGVGAAVVALCVLVFVRWRR